MDLGCSRFPYPNEPYGELSDEQIALMNLRDALKRAFAEVETAMRIADESDLDHDDALAGLCDSISDLTGKVLAELEGSL